MRVTWLLLPALLTLASVAFAQPSPGLMCDGIYCREAVDQQWQIAVTGKVVSLAGIYLLVHDADGRLLHQGKIPSGEYPTNAPYVIAMDRDGIIGDYLITVLGSQPDFRQLRLPYTSLAREVYGGMTFSVSPSQPLPWSEVAPGELVFQVTADQPTVTLTRSEIPWTLHLEDGSVVFDVREQGRQEEHPSNRRLLWVGTFTGEPGLTYRLGHSLHWFTVRPRIFLALTADHWFRPDSRLDALKWWIHVP